MLSDLYHRIEETRKASKQVMPVLLVACQIDRADCKVSLEEAQDWVAEYPGIVLAETSALTGEEIRRCLRNWFIFSTGTGAKASTTNLCTWCTGTIKLLIS